MLKVEKHVEFIKKSLKSRDLLFYLTEQDRITTLFWALNSLKILKDPLFNEMKESSLEFAMSCLKENGGFGPNPSYTPNIIATFNALQIFYIFNQPFFDQKTVNYILNLQTMEGCFSFDEFGDVDTRFDCCAILSLKLLSVMKNYCKHDLKNKSAFDMSELDNPIENEFLISIGFKINLTLQHLLSCYNPDGGFGQIKGSESHGAQVFCVVACLKTLGYLDYIDRFQTIKFLVNRQVENGGLNGRVNKKEDVCYSFWVYSSLKMLGAHSFIDEKRLIDFIYKCQDDDGGFSDRPGNEPDIYHLMYSLTSLSLLNESNLNEINPCFAI
jgi:geranylgeranyl transferase type-2 subunit beta